MRTAMVLGVCMAAVYPLCGIGAQSEADSLAIDVAAARAMLGHQYSTGAISIDPVEGANGHAPSNLGVGKRRTRAHTMAIAKVLSAAVRPYSDVTSCTGRRPPCAMSGVSAHLILSAPRIRNDTASVTATIYQNSPSKRQPVDYETVGLTVVRKARGWTVVKEVQLGISRPADHYRREGPGRAGRSRGL
jgi:hypothetical protein